MACLENNQEQLVKTPVLTNAEASTSALLLDDDHAMLNIVSESQTGDSLMEPTVADQPDKKPAGAQFWTQIN